MNIIYHRLLKSNLIRAFAIFVFICSSQVMAGGNSNLQIYQTKAEFADVRQNLIDAIVNHGYVLDFNGRVGDMLKRTRKDVGGEPLYRDAEYMVFCSAVISRNTMQADIHNIGFCPYILTIYETNAKPGTINVSYRKMSNATNTDQSLVAVEKMLDEIAREAVE
jgi:uncharacterized protein (DUF302 family)